MVERLDIPFPGLITGVDSLAEVTHLNTLLLSGDLRKKDANGCIRPLGNITVGAFCFVKKSQ